MSSKALRIYLPAGIVSCCVLLSLCLFAAIEKRTWGAYGAWTVLLAGAVLAAFLVKYLRAGANRLKAIEEIMAERGRELEKTNEALKQSEAKYRHIFESMEDVYYETDAEGTLTALSPSAYRVAGWRPEELVGKPVIDVYADPADRDTMMARLMREKRVNDYEVALRKKDGTIFFLSVSSRLIMDEDGYISGVAGILRDISERKQAQEALQKSEQKYRSIFENALEGIFQSTGDGRLLSVNPALARIHGYDSPEEMMRDVDDIGRKLWVSQEERMRYINILRKDNAVVFEAEQYRKDGSTCHLSLSTRAIKDETGRIIYYEGMVKDVTEQKRAQEALRTSQIKLSEAMDLAKLVYWEVDPATGEFVFNDTFYAFYGTTAEAQGGYRMSRDEYGRRFVHPDDLHVFRRFRERREANMAGEFQLEDVHRIVRGDGEARNVLTRVHVTRDAQGGVTRYYGANQDITEQKRAQETIDKSMALLRSIASASPIGIAVSTPERIILWMNDRLASLWGCGIDEMTGKSARLAYPTDEEFDRVGMMLRDEVWYGRIGTVDTRFMRKDGEILDVRLSAAPINPKDISDGVVFTVQDITDRKRAEEDLRNLNQRLTDVIEFLPDATFVIDSDKKIIAWNHAIEEMTGFRKEQMLGKGDHAYGGPFYGEPRRLAVDLVFSDDDDYAKSYDFFQRTGRTICVEHHAPLTVGGKSRNLLAVAAPFFNAGGNIIGAIQSIRDVTEQRRTEKTLRESEERYRVAIESSNDGVVLYVGPDIVYANKRFLDMFGYEDLEDAQCTDRFQKIDPQDREMVAGYTARREKGEYAPLFYECRGIGKNGATMYLEVSVADVTYLGKPAHLAYLRDVTEQKNLEAQLRQAQKMEAIGTLAGGVAHDFNNILAVIMGLSNLIQMTVGPDDRIRPHVDQIVVSSERAAELTQSLLAFSRKQQVDLRSHDVNAVVRSTAKLLKRLLPEDVELKVNTADNEIFTMLDVSQIDQVLMNLATNARDAMPNGGRFTITIKTVTLDKKFKKTHGFGKPGRYALISVSDTGVGMDEKTVARIFDPFFTTKEVGKGTGLGLSSVYGIVKQHGGYVAVDSMPGRGATFDVYLPLVDSEDRQAASEGVEVKGGSETILVVEDDAGVRSMMTRVLLSNGYRTLEAVDGGDAVQVFNKHREAIDLVILDVVIPGKNGKEVFDEMTRIDPSTKVIFVSGYTGDIVLDKGVRKDSVDFLQKPVAVSKLLSAVRGVLDR